MSILQLEKSSSNPHSNINKIYFNSKTNTLNDTPLKIIGDYSKLSIIENELTKNMKNDTNVTHIKKNEYSSYNKVSNFHNLKQIKQVNTNKKRITNHSILNDSYNYENNNNNTNITINRDLRLNASGRKLVKSKECDNSLNLDSRNSRSINSIKNEMIPFQANFIKFVDYQKNFRQSRSVKGKKEGIKIIDQIINNLAKLKTIIADENNEVDEEDKSNTIILNNLPYYDRNISSHEENINNALISSMTGETIKIANKNIFNIMKAKNFNKCTIDPENQHKQGPIRVDDNYNTINNNSLILHIRKDDNSMNFFNKRYSENGLETLDSKKNVNIVVRDTIFDEDKFKKRNLTPNNNRRYNYHIQNDTQIDLKNGDSKFKEDKFELKLGNEFILSSKKNSFPIKYSGTGDSKIKVNNNEKIQKNDIIINEDFLANYEFID